MPCSFIVLHFLLVAMLNLKDQGKFGKERSCHKILYKNTKLLKENMMGWIKFARRTSWKHWSLLKRKILFVCLGSQIVICTLMNHITLYLDLQVYKVGQECSLFVDTHQVLTEINQLAASGYSRHVTQWRTRQPTCSGLNIVFTMTVLWMAQWVLKNLGERLIALFVQYVLKS
jgi:hypothetical protein